MKCLICGGESAGDVCNKCIRLEKIVYQKEWSFKEGMLLKKVEGMRIVVSTLRISGRVAISDNPKGLKARPDNVSHYLLSVKECTQTTYQNKKTLMVVIEHNGFSRYLFLPGFEYGDQLVNAIFDAKQKAASLSERIRQNNGKSMPAPEAPLEPVSDIDYSSTADMNIINMDEEEAIEPVRETYVPEPAYTAAPVEPEPVVAQPVQEIPQEAPQPAASAPQQDFPTYDTVALSSLADDISEFETKIKKLKVLRDNGILSEEEYQIEKKKLVSIF